MNKYLLVIFLFISQISFAQKGSIKGVLIDTVGGENPIGNSTLSVLNRMIVF